jgi:hypothetical protein
VSDLFGIALIDVIASTIGCGKLDGRLYIGSSEVYILKGIGRLLKSR